LTPFSGEQSPDSKRHRDNVPNPADPVYDHTGFAQGFDHESSGRRRQSREPYRVSASQTQDFIQPRLRGLKPLPVVLQTLPVSVAL
jgi:hypothetical protein